MAAAIVPRDTDKSRRKVKNLPRVGKAYLLNAHQQGRARNHRWIDMAFIYPPGLYPRYYRGRRQQALVQRSWHVIAGHYSLQMSGDLWLSEMLSGFLNMDDPDIEVGSLRSSPIEATGHFIHMCGVNDRYVWTKGGRVSLASLANNLRDCMWGSCTYHGMRNKYGRDVMKVCQFVPTIKTVRTKTIPIRVKQ